MERLNWIHVEQSNKEQAWSTHCPLNKQMCKTHIYLFPLVLSAAAWQRISHLFAEATSVVLKVFLSAEQLTTRFICGNSYHQAQLISAATVLCVPTGTGTFRCERRKQNSYLSDRNIENICRTTFDWHREDWRSLFGFFKRIRDFFGTGSCV